MFDPVDAFNSTDDRSAIRAHQLSSIESAG